MNFELAVYCLAFFPRDDQTTVGLDDESDKIRKGNGVKV